MSIQPIGDRILVKALETETKTKGGLVLPDTAKEKPQEGEVIAVGQGKLQEDGVVRSLEVKKGDKVLFGKYAGTEIKLKDKNEKGKDKNEQYMILREDEILAIVKEKE